MWETVVAYLGILCVVVPCVALVCIIAIVCVVGEYGGGE